MMYMYTGCRRSFSRHLNQPDNHPGAHRTRPTFRAFKDDFLALKSGSILCICSACSRTGMKNETQLTASFFISMKGIPNVQCSQGVASIRLLSMISAWFTNCWPRGITIQAFACKLLLGIATYIGGTPDSDPKPICSKRRARRLKCSSVAGAEYR